MTTLTSDSTIQLPEVETCFNCGREWPARLGDHNCGFHRPHVHRDAIILEPGAQLLDSVRGLALRIETETCRSAQFAEIGGEASPYPIILGNIDATIGFLKHFRAQMQALESHTHRWDTDDYCSVCGADGRA